MAMMKTQTGVTLLMKGGCELCNRCSYHGIALNVHQIFYLITLLDFSIEGCMHYEQNSACYKYITFSSDITLLHLYEYKYLFLLFDRVKTA